MNTSSQGHLGGYALCAIERVYPPGALRLRNEDENDVYVRRYCGNVGKADSKLDRESDGDCGAHPSNDDPNNDIHEQDEFIIISGSDSLAFEADDDCVHVTCKRNHSPYDREQCEANRVR